MKKLVLLFVAGLISTALTAQNLPQPSPSGKLEQKVGLTDITIAYSRPSVKGRTIFGDLLDYDKIWRLGANACTKITCSTDMKIGGATVKAGTYAMFAIPSEKSEWTIIFNTDTEQWGAGNYDEAKNVATVKVKAMAHPMTETFTIGIENITNSGADISIVWEKVKINVPFTVNTQEIVMSSIDAAIKKGEDLDKVYYKAASYAFKTLGESEKAMSYLEESIGVKKTHNSLFLKAQILKKDGKKDEAIKAATEALEMAKAAEKKGWADYIAGYIEEWKK
ncbi:MAG: DUF2911 domain-containing protein [Crocinitomicaceae bacterium]